MFATDTKVFSDELIKLPKKAKWVAVISQTGSELAALMSQTGHLPSRVVLHNNPRLNPCAALEGYIKATFNGAAKVPYFILPSKATPSDYKWAFGDPNETIVTLHGFLKIIPEEICEVYEIWNGHPGLITVYPELKGYNPQEAFFKAKSRMPRCGSVIHRVTKDVDCGRVIIETSTTLEIHTLDLAYAVLRTCSCEAWISFIQQRFFSKPMQITTPVTGINDTHVQYCEERYPLTCEEFKHIQAEEYKLFCRKQHDYGPHNISLGSLLETPEDKRASLCAITFRLFDKVQRLLNLVVRKADTSPANESVDDAFTDISIYGIIAKIVSRGKWGK